MNILLLGAGGREHALAWKMTQSARCEQLFVAPGNAGTATLATNLPLAVTDFAGIAAAVRQHRIDLLVVGPEEPLVRGIRDFFEADPAFATLRIVGPGRAGAQLEGSKDFSKAFMGRHGIPTATARTFTADQLNDGLTYLQTHALPVVLKADGLAAGKGVVIAHSLAEAQATLRAMLEGQQFGEASQKVLVEQFLTGTELSVFVLTDGESYRLLPEAKDYKRIGAGDTGPNTGGMGAVSPVPFADAACMELVERQIIRPTLDGLRAEGIRYVGFLFFGLIRVGTEPVVIEYNARLGDPESQAIIPRIESDLVDLLVAAADQRLPAAELRVRTDASATVVLVSGGYPGAFEKGKPITSFADLPGTLPFFAGAQTDARGQVRTDGGRVLALTTLAPTLAEATQRATTAARTVQFEGKYFRPDIGWEFIN